MVWHVVTRGLFLLLLRLCHTHVVILHHQPVVGYCSVLGSYGGVCGGNVGVCGAVCMIDQISGN